jgi:hypothetical protein
MSAVDHMLQKTAASETATTLAEGQSFVPLWEGELRRNCRMAVGNARRGVPCGSQAALLPAFPAVARRAGTAAGPYGDNFFTAPGGTPRFLQQGVGKDKTPLYLPLMRTYAQGGERAST